MIDIDYYLNFYHPSLIESLQTCVHGTHDRSKLKRLEYDLWYNDGEIIEFSKGNRDFIAGYIPEGREDSKIMPKILNPRYKKKILRDGTLMVTHYDFTNDDPGKWVKQTFMCNEKTGLTLVEYTKLSKDAKKQYQ